MNAEALARWSHGTWSITPTFPITSVTQDSRRAALGTLYVALKGERHDGHDFVGAAFQAGATAAMVRTDYLPPADVAGLPLLRVADPAEALVALAKGYRQSLKTCMIGITGSAGKTTLKELSAAMLSGVAQASATPGNYNNAIGLPLSVLAIPEEARYAVIEAGISHPHDMDPLADILRPNAVAISSIGPAHIEAFGTEEAIATEKAKLLAAVPPEGVAVLPLEAHAFDVLKAACACRVVTCSLSSESSADYIGEPLAKGVVRVYHANEPAVLLETGLCGEHNASNVLIAYALARECGATPAQALSGLTTFKAPPMRWEVLTLRDIRAVNDAYNANPLSMRAALETFAGMDAPAEKVVCVGDMMELGDLSEAQHRAVGEASGNGPWRLLIGVGQATRALLEGAIAAGYPRTQTVWFATTEEAKEELPLLIRRNDTLLLKASRGMKLETLLEPLR